MSKLYQKEINRNDEDYYSPNNFNQGSDEDESDTAGPSYLKFEPVYTVPVNQLVDNEELKDDRKQWFSNESESDSETQNSIDDKKSGPTYIIETPQSAEKKTSFLNNNSDNDNEAEKSEEKGECQSTTHQLIQFPDETKAKDIVLRMKSDIEHYQADDGASFEKRKKILLSHIKKAEDNKTDYRACLRRLIEGCRFYFNNMEEDFSARLVRKIEYDIRSRKFSSLQDQIDEEEILSEITLANNGKRTFRECLQIINQIEKFNFRFKEEKNIFSANDAWFFWRFTNLNHAKYQYNNQPSDEAYRLLFLAEKACIKTNELVSKGGSTDLINNSRSSQEVAEISSLIRNTRDAVNKKVNEKAAELNLRDPISYRLRGGLKGELSAELAEQNRVGNCGEKSSVALRFLSRLCSMLGKEIGDFQAERFSIQGGDHVFLVIGRKPNSDPNDHTTWGADAVVCDPWSNHCFFAHEIPQHLKNYVVDRTCTPALRTTEPVHPCYHQLQNAEDIYLLKQARVLLHKQADQKDRKFRIMLPSKTQEARQEIASTSSNKQEQGSFAVNLSFFSPPLNENSSLKLLKVPNKEETICSTQTVSTSANQRG